MASGDGAEVSGQRSIFDASKYDLSVVTDWSLKFEFTQKSPDPLSYICAVFVVNRLWDDDHRLPVTLPNLHSYDESKILLGGEKNNAQNKQWS